MHLSRRAALAGAIAATTGMSPDQRAAVLGGASGPSLNLNFLTGVLDQRITFTRASTAWEFDSTGTLVSFSTNAPRFGYDPSTLAARGLLIEEARTNSLRNNSMVGAVAGTPGTLPSNWTISGLGTTTSVVGTGTESGLNYIDIRFAGTTTSAAQLFVGFEIVVTASAAQVWTGSSYFRLTAGSFANVTSIGMQTSVIAGTGTTLTTATITSAALAGQRVVATTAAAGVGTTGVRPFFVGSVASGVAVDFTIRIGSPQLELGSFATSPIVSTGANVTRTADVASMPLVTGAAFSLAAEAEVDAPLAFGTSQFSAQIDDGSSNNRATLYRVLTTGAASALFSAAGVGFINNTSLGVISPGTVYKSALAHANGLSKMVANAGAVTTSAAAGVIAQSTTLRLGTGHTGFSQLNGHLRRVSYWTRVIGDGELQAATT